jgi:GTPase SAR1 family protein
MPAKVCLLGLTQSGKTALYNRVVHECFDETQYTIGAIFGETRDFGLWDTAGNQRFYALTQFYIKDSAAIILVVDPTSENFEDQLAYLDSGLKPLNPSPALLLVATKSDLVNSLNKAMVDANIEAFYKKFAKEGDPKPLFVSATDANSRALIYDQLVLCLKASKHLPENAPLDLSILERIKPIERKIESRLFKADSSRFTSIDRLKNTLRNCLTVEDVKNTLIEEALFLRSPDENGKLRYGVNFGSTRLKFFFHFRSYEHSELYQFLKSELRRIDRKLDLATLSDPKLVRQAPAVAAAAAAGFTSVN